MNFPDSPDYPKRAARRYGLSIAPSEADPTSAA
jgi:hypothetical protein